MDPLFLRGKLVRLSDERVVQLLAFKHVKNPVFSLAVEEARRRNLDVSELDLTVMVPVMEPRTTEGLERWNWAAVLSAPLWTLAHRLDRKWAVLCWVFPVNIFIVLYLGANGNKLAFEKSDITNVADFLKLQEVWVRCLVQASLIGCVIAALLYIIFGLGQRYW